MGTLVECNSRLLMLVKLPLLKPASAANVLQDFSDKLNAIAKPMRQSMTCGQRREMAMHARLTQQTRDRGVLLRPAQPVAEGQQRQHEWAGTLRIHICSGSVLMIVRDATGKDAITGRAPHRFERELAHFR